MRVPIMAGFFGFGWDNFTSTVLDEFFSDVVADITFSGDDFLNLSFAYLATDDSLSYDALERDTTFRHPYELLRYDEVQFGLQTVADYAEAMSTGLYPDDLSQTFEVLFPSLGGPAVDPATPLDQAEGMTTSLGDPPSIDDLLDALDRMDAPGSARCRGLGTGDRAISTRSAPDAVDRRYTTARPDRHRSRFQEPHPLPIRLTPMTAIM